MFGNRSRPSASRFLGPAMVAAALLAATGCSDDDVPEPTTDVEDPGTPWVAVDLVYVEETEPSTLFIEYVGPCVAETDRKVTLVDGDERVEVGLEIRGDEGPDCPSDILVDLANPLGGRAVVDSFDGAPIPQERLG